MKYKNQKRTELILEAIYILNQLSEADSQAEKIGILVSLLRKIR